MRVLILGFDNVKEIDNTMEKLIESTQCFLFTIVCGNRDNAAYEYSILRGAPCEFIQIDNPTKLIYYADYIVLKINEGTPQWMKNLLMAFKSAGKHGTVVR